LLESPVRAVVSVDCCGRRGRLLASRPYSCKKGRLAIRRGRGRASHRLANMTFTSVETAACTLLVEWALREDLGKAGDVTTQAIIPRDATGQALLVARAPGVLAGLDAAQLVFAAIDSSVRFEPLLSDGGRVSPGVHLARMGGSMRSILAGERIALNFVQHLSGIATLTQKYVEAIAGLSSRILDTRKTL